MKTKGWGGGEGESLGLSMEGKAQTEYSGGETKTCLFQYNLPL